MVSAPLILSFPSLDGQSFQPSTITASVFPAAFPETVSADELLSQQTPGQAPTTAPGGEGTPPEDVDSEDTPPSVELFPERGGALLPQGTLVFEPSVEYNLSNVNRVEVAGFSVLPAILVGEFAVESVERENVTPAISVRYGITDRLDAQVRVPYVFRSEDSSRRPIGVGADEAEAFNTTGSGLGDIEFATNYQINQGLDDWPFFIANLRVRVPTGRDPFEIERDDDGNELELATGTGFFGIQPSVTVLYPNDPAVLFANLGYTWNLERDIGDEFGLIDPGDIVNLSGGVGIGLNERTSITLGYDHQVVGRTSQNGQIVEGSRVLNIGRLLFGASFRVSDSVGVNVTVAPGVTEDAPDLTATLRVPITFTDIFGDD